MNNDNFLNLISETSERSDSDNWVKKELIRNGIKIICFEGYTLKDNLVTALFDRRNLQLVINNSPMSKQIFQLICKQQVNSAVIDIKWQKLLNVVYLIASTPSYIIGNLTFAIY